MEARRGLPLVEPGVDTAFEVCERDRDRLGPLLSAAIAFRLFLVFVPYVAFLVILAGVFGVDRSDLATAGAGASRPRRSRTSRHSRCGARSSRSCSLRGLLLASRSMVKACCGHLRRRVELGG